MPGKAKLMTGESSLLSLVGLNNFVKLNSKALRSKLMGYTFKFLYLKSNMNGKTPN